MSGGSNQKVKLGGTSGEDIESTGGALHTYPQYGVVAATKEYSISDEDTSVSDIEYYGFLKDDGSWYILKIDSSITNMKSYRYVAGTSDYVTNWIDRANQSYSYYNEVF